MKDPEHARRGGAPRDAVDHYRLLQIDPDAPQELVAEAYWYLAGKLRADLPVRRSAERELLALNTAYAALAVAEQRQAYDATVSRVMEIRRERAERARAPTERPLLTRLFGTPESPQRERDSYELLRIDPSAEPPLIARAYSILRTLHLREGAGEAPKEYIRELTTALTTLLDGDSRAAYDESLKAAAAARASSVSAAEPRESEAGSGGGSADARKAGGLGLGRWRQPREGSARGLLDERLLRDAVRDAAPAAAKRRRREPASMCVARLIILSPPGEGETISLGDGPIILGSDQNCRVRLPVETGKIAPAHAEIWCTGDRYVIRSLDPLSPTIVCGQKVNWAGLDDGDEIEIGSHRLRFETAGGPERPPNFLTIEHDAAASAEQIPERHE